LSATNHPGDILVIEKLEEDYKSLDEENTSNMIQGIDQSSLRSDSIFGLGVGGQSSSNRVS